MTSVTATQLVVPCYNEATRLNLDQFLTFTQHPSITLLFVDDGSTDATRSLLKSFCEQSGGKALLLPLERNQGKGEAIRQGFQHALEHNPAIVGYIDADLATPPQEVFRMLDVLQQDSRLSVVMGCRHQRLGTHIERLASRHYIGRVFATAASLILGIPVYDTQCGAKLFRHETALKDALSQPFQSRWIFDVELIGRLLHAYASQGENALERFLEFPLNRWRDVQGSKLGKFNAPLILWDLLRVAYTLRYRGA